MLELLKRESVAQLVIVRTLQDLPEDNRLSVFNRVKSALYGEPAESIHAVDHSVIDDEDRLEGRALADFQSARAAELDTETDDWDGDYQDPSEIDPSLAEPKERRRVGPRTSPKTPRLRAINETVALAIKLGSITNGDVSAKSGLTSSGADQRIQSAIKAERLKRIKHGHYVAVREEYIRLGLSPEKCGHEHASSVASLVELMEAAPLAPKNKIDLCAMAASEDEKLIVSAFNGVPRTIGELAAELFDGNASRVRNALRRPVKKWAVIKQVGRGQYAKVSAT